MSHRYKVIATLLMMFVFGSALAKGFDVKTYQSFKSLPESQRLLNVGYQVGVARGLIVMNEKLIYMHRKPLFCIPDEKWHAAYSGATAALNEEIANPTYGKPLASDTAIELVMLQALISRYPCSRQ